MDVSKTRSQTEIDDLKQCWKGDPIWDLEGSEGFEAHEAELLEFRLNCEKEWHELENDRLMKKSIALGCGGNVILAAYIDNLERRISLEYGVLEYWEVHVRISNHFNDTNTMDKLCADFAVNIYEAFEVDSKICEIFEFLASCDTTYDS